MPGGRGLFRAHASGDHPMLPTDPHAAAPHPARLLSYGDLEAGLHAARSRRMVLESRSADGLSVWVYTRRCVYEGAWDAITTIARGLVLDPAGRQVVATPFPKIFNLGERGAGAPDLPFEAYEKLDGSMVTAFWHAGRWRVATKGAFGSPQAAWAQQRLDAADLSPLVPGTTYIFEAVYPENRVVVHYGWSALALLAAYRPDGYELSFESIMETAAALGWPAARRSGFASVEAAVEYALALPRTAEGLVLRFASGLRLKVKGGEYRRVHALVSRVTPLAVWEAMQAGDNLESIRQDLPEEFWGDFDDIVRLLDAELAGLAGRVAAAASSVSHLSDRELGGAVSGLPDDVRPFVFGWRRGVTDLHDPKHRRAAYQSIRPAADRLAGYRPSWAVKRFGEEAG